MLEKPRPSLDSFLNPRSIALFGASEDETKLRGRITRIIVENGYAGALHFINPNRTEVAGRPCHQNISSIRGPIDLAIIVVPAAEVMTALEDCASAGVAHALIMSSGFAEEGGAQADVQERIAALARRSGMRVCGPNAEGFHNEAANLSATFSPAVEITPDEVFAASSARVAVVAQSGGVGFSLYHRGRHLGLLFSTVVTTGNEVDLTAADFLDHLVDDSDTAIVLLFLETIRDGATFVRALERAAAARKPVIVLKVGRSAAGGRATVSHTGAIAGWDAAYDAMFATHGVMVAEDIGRALAIVAGFVTNPLPRGKRAAVVTVSGGAGALAADRLTARGFELPQLSSDIQAAIRAIIPSYGATANPVDVTGQSTRTGAPLRTIEMLSEGDEIDFTVMTCTMSNRTKPPVDVDGLARLAGRKLKPIFFFTYTLPSDFGLRAVAKAGFITFTALDDVAAAAAAMLGYRRFLDAREVGNASAPITARRLSLSPGTISEHDAKHLLAEFGIAIPPRILIGSSRQIADIPAQFFPAAAKIQSSRIPHKTEAKGVHLNIADTTALGTAYKTILAAAEQFHPGAEIDGVLVEPMASPGIEMIVGVVRDPAFGPIITVGAGGVAAELLQDAARLQGPVNKRQAMDMIRSLRCFRLLEGYRGAPRADLDALAGLVVMLSEFAASYVADVGEVELNPVAVHPEGNGVTVIDALIVIDPKAA